MSDKEYKGDMALPAEVIVIIKLKEGALPVIA